MGSMRRCVAMTLDLDRDRGLDARANMLRLAPSDGFSIDFSSALAPLFWLSSWQVLGKKAQTRFVSRCLTSSRISGNWNFAHRGTCSSSDTSKRKFQCNQATIREGITTVLSIIIRRWSDFPFFLHNCCLRLVAISFCAISSLWD